MTGLTVGELRAILADPAVGDERLVILASDAEGNSFAPVRGDTEEIIYSHSTGYWDAEGRELLVEPEPGDDGTIDEEEIGTWVWAQEHGIACLCLWPQ